MRVRHRQMERLIKREPVRERQRHKRKEEGETERRC